MSNLERLPEEAVCGGLTAVAANPTRELMPGRDVALGPRGMSVSRTLPSRGRRMVGAWCFIDHYGPELVSAAPMRVPPHPHTGLQTVSWLLEGEVLHRDSLGNSQLVTPGQLNLMTAGNAIAHAEETPREHSPTLHGVQLWVALPGGDRAVAPSFDHYPELPVLTDSGVAVTVVMGDLGGTASPATVYSPLVGADVTLAAGADARLPLRPEFEYAALALIGTVLVDEVPLEVGPLLYLGCGRSDLAVRTDGPGRLLLIGGEPFDEEIVMWWNFVGRSHEDIVAAREDWMAGTRFGVVPSYDGAPLPAPPLPTTRLKPRGRHS